MSKVRYLHHLLLGLWVGGLSAFGAIFVPGLFRALEPWQVALVMREVLPRLDLYALVAGPGLIALGLYARWPPSSREMLRLVLLVGMVGLAMASLFRVGPQLGEVRARARGEPLDPQEEGLPWRSLGLKLGELGLGLVVLGLVPGGRREDVTADPGS